jgi:hypothetical protein
MTRAVKETPVLTALHELKEQVKRKAHVNQSDLVLTMREVITLIEHLEDEYRLRWQRGVNEEASDALERVQQLFPPWEAPSVESKHEQ